MILRVIPPACQVKEAGGMRAAEGVEGYDSLILVRIIQGIILTRGVGGGGVRRKVTIQLCGPHLNKAPIGL